MSVPSYVKTYSYTPTKNLTSSQSTNYTQNRESVIRAVPSSEGKYTSSMFQASYVGKDPRFRSIHERYERQAEDVHRNYEQHYRDQLEMGDVMTNTQQQFEAEQKKVFALETRLNECYRELDQEKRHRLELARENTELRTNSRRNEALMSGYEMTVSNVQQNATGVNYENETLRQELKKLSDICNAKLKEMDEKHKNEVEKLNDELDELRSKIKEKDIDAEAKVRGVSRELEAKIRSLENQLREKARIINENESEVKSMKDYNMKTKMQFEEELRRQINIVKDQERVKPEGAVKELETKVNELDTDNEILKKKAAELAQEMKNKDKAMKDMKVKVEDQVGHLRRENIDLKDQISVSASEIERLQLELKGTDSSIARLQNEIRTIKNDLAGQKDSYLNEINRLVGKNDADIKRFQEYERQLKARITELEKQVKMSQAESSKAKHDLERFRDHVSGNIEKSISQTFGDYGAKTINSKYPC